MADGVTWDKRSEGDWLASNGKWYSSSKYPRGWETSALPPAPGQGGVNSILQKYASKASELTGIDGAPAKSRPPGATTSPEPQRTSASTSASPPSAPPRQPVRTKTPPTSRPAANQPTSGFSVMDPGRRRVADATVTDESDYAHKVGAGAPPPKQLPPPPGRVGSDSNAGPPEPTAAPPSDSSVPAVQKPPPPATRSMVNNDGGINFDVVAGDFGKILGGAKKRIEQALNEPLEKK